MDYWPGLFSSCSLHVLSMSVWVFSRDSGFLPHPEDVQLGELSCLKFPRPSECCCLCVALG